MTKKTFSTDRQIAALSPLDGQKQTEYSHTKENGIILRVGAKKKSWAVKYQIDGKRKKYTLPLGYPDMSLADAVTECRRIRSEAAKGNDPLGRRQFKKSAPTVADVFEHYFKVYVLRKRKAASSIKEDLRQWKTLEDRIGNIKAQDLTRKNLIDLHNDMTQKGSPIMANRTLALISTAYNAALDAEMINGTPCTRLKSIMNAEKSRQRFLADGEIKILWKAMDNEADNMRDILRLILLTAQRPGEIAAMEISEIDPGTKIWTLPGSKTKNGQTHQVPLHGFAWAIVEPRLINEKWIFKTNHGRNGTGKTHTKSTKGARRRLQHETGIMDWTAHDLRRTARTIMAREGVLPYVAERVINHKQGKMEAVYDQHAYQNEKAEALLRLEKTILKIIGQSGEPATIIPIRRAVG